MFTEDELRNALGHSAARADEIDASPTASANWDLSGAHRRQADRGRLPNLLGIGLVLCAIVGVTVGVLSTTGGRHLDASSVNVGNGRVKTTSIRPPASHSADVTTPAMLATIGLNNLVTIGGLRDGYSLGAAGGPEVKPVFGTDAVYVIAIPKTTPFDPAADMTNAEPVTIAGTSGFFGNFTLDGLSPNGASPGDKYGPARSTVAWQGSDQTWVLVQGMNVGVNLPLATLEQRVAQLDIAAVPAPLPTMPVRFGWLPVDLTLSSVDQPSSGSAVPYTVLGFASSTGSVTLTLSPQNVSGQVSSVGGGSPSAPFATRLVDTTQITVTVTGLSQATAQRILDALDLSKFAAAPSTWWTLAEALSPS